ncbi:MAG: hypothetical protein E7255_06485 [Lachnospiraceae bacterium]|nr:hypothetical protein [Lachnospiraceae bacterium]
MDIWKTVSFDDKRQMNTRRSVTVSDKAKASITFANSTISIFMLDAIIGWYAVNISSRVSTISPPRFTTYFSRPFLWIFACDFPQKIYL